MSILYKVRESDNTFGDRLGEMKKFIEGSEKWGGLFGVRQAARQG